MLFFRKWSDRQLRQARLRMAELTAESMLLSAARRSYDSFSYDGPVHIEVIQALYRSKQGALFFATTRLDHLGLPVYRCNIQYIDDARAREWLLASGGDPEILSRVA